MIRATHATWAEGIFHAYVRWLFRKQFHALHVLGDVPSPSEDHPLLLLPNHSTWWDGFFIYWLNQCFFHRPAYLMMMEEQLSRYRFFSKIGAFSVDSTSPKRLLISMNYALSLLNEDGPPPPLMCIFPQGELQPWGTRPLGYKRGVEWLLQKYGEAVHMLPLAIRLEFLGEQRPEAFFLFGKNDTLHADTFPGVDWLEDIEGQLLDDLARRIAQGERGGLLLGGTRSINRRLDRWTEKLGRTPKTDRDAP